MHFMFSSNSQRTVTIDEETINAWKRSQVTGQRQSTIKQRTKSPCRLVVCVCVCVCGCVLFCCCSQEGNSFVLPRSTRMESTPSRVTLPENPPGREARAKAHTRSLRLIYWMNLPLTFWLLSPILLTTKSTTCTESQSLLKGFQVSGPHHCGVNLPVALMYFTTAFSVCVCVFFFFCSQEGNSFVLPRSTRMESTPSRVNLGLRYH